MGYNGGCMNEYIRTSTSFVRTDMSADCRNRNVYIYPHILKSTVTDLSPVRIRGRCADLSACKDKAYCADLSPMQINYMYGFILPYFINLCTALSSYTDKT